MTNEFSEDGQNFLRIFAALKKNSPFLVSKGFGW
jgi:hypothetical protein